MLTEELSKQIKYKLIERNLTQSALADKFGITRQYLNGIISRRFENLQLETKLLAELNIDDTRTTTR